MKFYEVKMLISDSTDRLGNEEVKYYLYSLNEVDRKCKRIKKILKDCANEESKDFLKNKSGVWDSPIDKENRDEDIKRLFKNARSIKI